MESEKNVKKRILKPSIIHDDLPILEESNKATEQTENEPVLPENPERNYHHGVNHIIQDYNEITSADDDIWNGEDA